MKAFAALYRALDATTSTAAKQAALQAYFREVPPADAAWAVYLLAGGKPRQTVPPRRLRELARAAAGLPEWLFDECYQAAGDLAETIALLLPPPAEPEEHGLAHWMAEVLALRALPADERDAALRAQWARLPAEQRLLHGKLITGGLRVGVSRQQVTQALATVAGVPPALVAQRLMGYTRADARPGPQDYQTLLAPPGAVADPGTMIPAEAMTGAAAPMPDAQPYPFFLAHPLPAEPDDPPGLLGAPADWIVEWKWDGIRAQLVRRRGVALWTRGEELVTDRYPELAALGQRLPPGTVLDGEIVVVAGEALQPFGALQRRIGRQRLTAALLRELPVALIAYDLLEADGRDCRAEPQWRRRERLQALVAALADPALRLSPALPITADTDWAALSAHRRTARERGAEGLMLKQRDGQYGIGRTRAVGTWWKWKADPWTVDAVLVYAQKGHGRRAGLYSDYTFAIWSHAPGHPQRHLVPFAKAYSGLSDAEMARVDAIIRSTTRESFGPVRAVEPTLVFELGFEGIARSPRHKSGVAVRFPRMLRWRTDKGVEDVDCLPTLLAWLEAANPGGAP
ncbi:ATP-dependent DNA ligase [Tepidimonas sp.]|uniref:ATP-dependent DNA ligase n=1 Tax=Tepidimonas sp. TaxID=2002775 RepID=UPI002FE32A47